jgi:predicted SAM-dependent methyltransferase
MSVQTNTNEPIRLNIGCGGRPLIDYLNVDMDDLGALRRRYPHQTFSDDIRLVNYDIFNLPLPDNSVAEVRADGLLEHLPFIEEPRFLYEVKRILQPGGKFIFSVPDFEQVCKNWLAAKDDWKDFYRMDDEAIATQHWFGTNTYRTDNRWGYITATIYGSQHGEGQYHRNCYSEDKIRSMCAKLGFDVVKLEKFLWKGDRDPMLNAEVVKRG